MTNMADNPIIVYIAVAALITFLLRLLPFVVFNDKTRVPDIVNYLGEYLPASLITGITVYCFKTIDFTAFPYGAKEIMAAAVVAGLHLWKRNMLISVFLGTVFYMVAVQNF